MPGSSHTNGNRIGSALSGSGERRSGTRSLQDEVLIDDPLVLGNDRLPGLVDLLDDIGVDFDFGDTAVALINDDRVTPVILDSHLELSPLDAKRGILRHEHCLTTRVVDVETGRQDSVVRCRRIQNLGKPIGVDSVEFDANGPTAGEPMGLSQSTAPRRPHLLEKPDRTPGVCPHFIHPRLLTIEFFDDNEREDDLVLVESQDRLRICEQDARVENVRLLQGALSGVPRQHIDQVARPRRELQGCNFSRQLTADSSQLTATVTVGALARQRMSYALLCSYEVRGDRGGLMGNDGGVAARCQRSHHDLGPS